MPAWEYSCMWREGGFITFSQNFITDPFLIKRLLEQSDISVSDKVVEIGAGKGLITKELSKRCKQVIAVEIDKNYYNKLSRTITDKNIILINNDILNVELPKDNYKVFSNIPFNYTSRIMNKLYFQTNAPQSAYIILQKEASEMYVGPNKETQKSLLLKPFFSFENIHKFSKKDFTPSPKVDIVLLRICKIRKPLISENNKAEYFDLIVYGTTQFKPTLYKALSKVFTYKQFKRLSKYLQFSMNAKPLDLTVNQWIELYKYFKSGVSENKQLLVKGSYKKQQLMQGKLVKTYRTRKRSCSHFTQYYAIIQE